MSNFRASFEKGQEAVRKAELMRKEIDDVFIELNKQISEITDGKLEILRIRKYSDNTISAKNPKAKDKSEKQIARWEQSHDGYPCTIYLTGVETFCHDRESLEKCLSLLLEDAWISEKLKAIINSPLE